MPTAFAYCEHEADYWTPLPSGIYITSLMLEHSPPTFISQSFVRGLPRHECDYGGFRFSALLFDDGRVWDGAYKDWRPCEPYDENHLEAVRAAMEEKAQEMKKTLT